MVILTGTHSHRIIFIPLLIMVTVMMITTLLMKVMSDNIIRK